MPFLQISTHSPPLLLFHGGSDSVILPDQSERMREAARRWETRAVHFIEDLTEKENRWILLDFLRRHLEPGS